MGITITLIAIFIIVGAIMNGSGASLTRMLVQYKFQASESGKPYFLLIDTETSGLPRYRTDNYREKDTFPRIIQLAYMVFDEAGGIIERESTYLNIDVVIDPGAYRIHRIDGHKLAKLGKLPEEVYAGIAATLRNIKVIVAHNQEFDIRILQSELWRFGHDVDRLFEDKEIICTMLTTRAFVGIRHANGGYKYPKLRELYGKLFHDNVDINVSSTHDASIDVTMLGRCFLELSNKGIIDLERIKKRVSNKELARKHTVQNEDLLGLHTKKDSLLIYQNLSNDDIMYLSNPVDCAFPGNMFDLSLIHI
jgi:DNA polymerase-3 subunit epsilon